jgi:FtsP/CotA-like multicopper oxidase with cupredoxin domain
MTPLGHPLTRREFLRLAAGGTALMGGAISVLSSCDTTVGPDDPEPSRSALRAPAALSVTAAALVAAPGTADIGGGESSSAWLFNGLLSGPTLRARQGEQARIRLVNQLPEPTIVHWHGVIVPDHADGHPRHAIDPGMSFDYEFPVMQRAGTFWYHPHPHHLTAGQIHRGLAGFFIVTDAEEDALNLPSGPFEILLLLQDRDGDPAATFGYAPTADDLHSGMLRDVPFGNGVRLPTVAVIGARYRFRVLNASQARVYRLALDNRAALTVIGNDGGLLPSPVEVDSVYLGVGERIDFLVDFATFPPGSRTMLKSLPFPVPSAPVTPFPQGIELDLLELVRDGAAGARGGPLPAVLSSAPEPGGAVVGERSFVLRSIDQEHGHQINDHTFVPERVDERISLGQVERWTFRNDSSLPHPVHLHGTHFQILSRTGGRNVVFPYEAGWKDTVLVMPLEAVVVQVCFERYPGLFPLHCHNLQHEDLGMMLNIEVS